MSSTTNSFTEDLFDQGLCCGSRCDVEFISFLDVQAVMDQKMGVFF
jgi:hypothetical protein